MNTDTQNTPANDLPMAITRAIESVERGEPVPGAPATGNSRPVDPAPADSAAVGATPTQQPRDGSGKFAPKPAPAAPTDKPSVAPAEAPPAAAPDTATATQPAAIATPDPLAAAPASWREEAKAKWEKLPSEARAEVYRREREIDRALDASAERAKAASAVLDEFAPYAEILQAEGASPTDAIRTLLQTAYALRSSGPEYRKTIFLDLARQYGVDLTTGLNSAQAEAEARAANYDIAMRHQRAAQDQQQMAYAEQILHQFAATHEHFPVVREIMGNLMATGVCADLETAYQQAVVLSPQLRPMLIEAEARKFAQEDARRRAAASSVTGAPGGFSSGGAGAPSTDAKTDLRGAIAAAMDRAGSR
jgi:hypothetical protein